MATICIRLRVRRSAFPIPSVTAYDSRLSTPAPLLKISTTAVASSAQTLLFFKTGQCITLAANASRTGGTSAAGTRRSQGTSKNAPFPRRVNSGLRGKSAAGASGGGSGGDGGGRDGRGGRDRFYLRPPEEEEEEADEEDNDADGEEAGELTVRPVRGAKIGSGRVVGQARPVREGTATRVGGGRVVVPVKPVREAVRRGAGNAVRPEAVARGAGNVARGAGNVARGAGYAVRPEAVARGPGNAVREAPICGVFTLRGQYVGRIPISQCKTLRDFKELVALWLDLSEVDGLPDSDSFEVTYRVKDSLYGSVMRSEEWVERMRWKRTCDDLIRVYVSKLDTGVVNLYARERLGSGDKHVGEFKVGEYEDIQSLLKAVRVSLQRLRYSSLNLEFGTTLYCEDVNEQDIVEYASYNSWKCLGPKLRGIYALI